MMRKGVLYEGATYQGLALPFRPCVGDIIMVLGESASEHEVLKVQYFAGKEYSENCEFVGFLITVRKLSP
jgi:hypothetical protein